MTRKTERAIFVLPLTNAWFNPGKPQCITSAEIGDI